MRIIGLILNKQRPTSHISRLHSRHLLGKGYNEIIAKISENQEKMKKNLRIKSSKQSSGKKLSRFQIDKSDLNLYAAKKKLADEISQMIISNLKNSRDASGYLHDDNGREDLHKNKHSVSKFYKQEIPDVEKFIVPFRRSMKLY